MKFKFTQYLKSIKAPSSIYADLDSLIKKIIGFKSNPEKLSIRKPDKHIPCSYKISAIWTFYNIEKMHDVNRERTSIKFLWIFTRPSNKTRNFEKKEMVPLTNKKLESYGR